MRHGSKAFKFGAAFAAFGTVLGSTASAAPRSISAVDPLVSLSVFGTSSSRAAVCAAGTAATGAAAAAATTAQPGPGPGCVLPVLGQQAPPPVVEVPMAPMAPIATGGGFNIGGLLPLFAVLGLGALAIYLLENEDDDEENPLSPF